MLGCWPSQDSGWVKHLRFHFAACPATEHMQVPTICHGSPSQHGGRACMPKISSRRWQLGGAHERVIGLRCGRGSRKARTMFQVGCLVFNLASFASAGFPALHGLSSTDCLLVCMQDTSLQIHSCVLSTLCTCRSRNVRANTCSCQSSSKACSTCTI